ncbi:hypothetical protein C9374_009631 [Naegleria lovaniensis]|uniref:Ciliary BBSome complex subunit 2 middle region domain-containing protein n=1 Tax=Naegleria lovaniensis TaxID=51637 RepID=A0AA88KRW4_NAELO|nr:uncharacterized protein C9374_009631 [Naegleria lovaniensis]KAG2393054.1 hypothetical protein C9374_009631 [Naegleria lovaniensis]
MSELQTRLDLLKTSSVSSDCLKLFPVGKKKTQRVAVGDNDGSLQAFSVKKGAVNTTFKTINQNKPVRGVQIHKNRVFYSYGQVVKGVTKKGKEFYRLDSNISEDATRMVIRVPGLWMGGNYILYHYVDSVEKGFYMCPDRINTIIPYFDCKDAVNDQAILGCQDRKLRVVCNTDCVAQYATEGAVTSLLLNEESNSLIYGTETGQVISLDFNSTNPSASWRIEGEKGSVNEMCKYDINGDGKEELIVARNDGTLEVYSFINPSQPTRLLKKTIDESITCVTAGKIIAPEDDEILVSTFSGRLLAFSNHQYTTTNESSNLNLPFNIIDDKKKIVGISKSQRITNLQKELESLDEKLTKVKQNYSKLSSEIVAVHCEYETKASFILDAKDAYYRLNVESDVHMEMIIIRSEIALDLLDSSGDNNVVVSNIVPDEKKDLSTKFSATFRFTDNCKRIEVLFRTYEGKYGPIEIYVIPKLHPKISKFHMFNVKPLSLHERLDEQRAKSFIGNRPLNKLIVSGSFTLSEVHSWIGLCVEGIPDKITEDEMTYYYHSTFQDTCLIIKLKRGEAVIETDNITAISVVEEVITKAATERKTKVNISFEINDASFEYTISLLYPKLEYQLNLSEKIKFIDALKEIQIQEEDLSFLSSEYKSILDDSDVLLEDAKYQTKRLDFLNEILIRMFMDCLKFKRKNAQQYLPSFKQLLESRNYNRDALSNCFKF